MMLDNEFKTFLLPVITGILLVFLIADTEHKNGESTVIDPFQQFSYTMENGSVPDFIALKTVIEKKTVFFDFMRPIIENENLKILKKRSIITRIINTRNRPFDDRLLAESIASDYGMHMFDINSFDDQLMLLSKIDIVPVPLALAQSANETAWGTSRFARIGNNMFGQWCFTKGNGIIPEKRDAGATHEVAKFKSVNDSVAGYLHNLNTGKSYAGFRQLRQQMRFGNKPLDPVLLTQGLLKYSSEGRKYVNVIISMIKSNEHL